MRELKLQEIPDIKWVVPEVKAGELLTWLQELPHRNLRNKSKTERIVAYVSLFPRAYLPKGVSLREMFLSTKKSGHAGTNRSGDDEKELFKDTWKERVALEESPIVKKALAED